MRGSSAVTTQRTFHGLLVGCPGVSAGRSLETATPRRVSPQPARGTSPFQAQFHWHLADHGIRHVYIKARTPQLNGKVERSHGTDKQAVYQLLTYTGDVDLNEKLVEWENCYNYQRPHGAVQGKTPYEAFCEKLG